MKNYKIECISLSEMISNQDIFEQITSPALSEIYIKPRNIKFRTKNIKKKKLIRKYSFRKLVENFSILSESFFSNN